MNVWMYYIVLRPWVRISLMRLESHHLTLTCTHTLDLGLTVGKMEAWCANNQFPSFSFSLPPLVSGELISENCSMSAVCLRIHKVCYERTIMWSLFWGDLLSSFSLFLNSAQRPVFWFNCSLGLQRGNCCFFCWPTIQDQTVQMKAVLERQNVGLERGGDSI